MEINVREATPRIGDRPIGAVLVVGGGIGGIQAALDLAESGYYVYLVEKSPSIGGVMAQLDKTFPTLDCSICILSPKLVECGRHPNIEILSYSELLEVEGEPGNFKARVLKRARYVNESLCTGCGICQEKCPWKTESEFEQGLAQRKAIYIPYAQAIPNIPVIDRELCAYLLKGRCRTCRQFCPTGAIDFSQTDKELELHVGSIILCPGFDEFDPTPLFNYGYKKYPCVVTSIDFERMLSASGPYQGELFRPSDRTYPRRIAWIQCVGSRDISSNCGYCSSVCCTYAIKEALVAQEHVPHELEETIFFMDMRTQGKGFDRFYERAKEEGIKFVRAKVYQVEEARGQEGKGARGQEGTGNLMVKYSGDDGKVDKAEFDLVVLSVGIQPSPEVMKLAKKLGIQLNHYGFCHTHPFTPIETTKPGIFVCGAFSGPKDIPETVMQASGAAAKSASLLSSSRGALIREKIYPTEKDVASEEPRIGVFVCHCGINIGGVVDVPDVAAYAKTLPNVVYTENTLYSCSQDAQEKIKKIIEEYKLNRVVVASCSPRTHETLFQETIRESGLNKYLFEMTNIRDQCSWVHRDIPEEATWKAKELVKMAVAKAALIQPLPFLTIPVTPKASIIGGGVTGMMASLELANQGFECFLIERSDKLGGNARRLRHTLEGDDISKFLEELIQNVEQHQLIHVYKNAEIKEISGYVGNFKTRVIAEGKEDILEHGVIIVATGGREYHPSEFGIWNSEFGMKKTNNSEIRNPKSEILTQLELEEKLAEGSLNPGEVENVVMIQCVGSRTKERLYCSKVCCSQAVKNALKIKELNPFSNVYVLYKDLRTYSFKEEFYQKARDVGVAFLRYPEENEPEVTIEDEKIKITIFDPLLGEELIIMSDLLVLSVGILPEEGTEELAKMLKVPLNEDGFFLEAHVKLRPVEFASEGIFVAGLAHSPKPIEESISQALVAAGKAAITLSKGFLSVEPIVSTVDEEKCIGCGLCESLCAFGAIRLVSKDGTNKAETIAASCKGCGLCAANCPQHTISMGHFTDEEITAQIRALGIRNAECGMRN